MAKIFVVDHEYQANVKCFKVDQEGTSKNPP